MWFLNDRQIGIRPIMPAAHVVSKLQQTGSALTEMIVLGLVMVPLMFTVPMLGKLIDLKQQSIQASRYLAWQQTHAPQQARNTVQTQNELRQRFFSSAELPLETLLDGNNSGFAGHHLWGSDTTTPYSSKGSDDVPEMWQSLSFSDSVQIRDSSSVFSVNDNGLPEAAKLVSEGVNLATSVIDTLSSAEWDVATNGVYAIDMGIETEVGNLLSQQGSNCDHAQSGDQGEVADTGSTSGPGTLCFGIRSAILADGWSAASDAQARRRVQTMVPATVLDPLGNVLSVLGALPIFKELRPLDDSFGHVDVNVLPLDRYRETN